jgi:hypothetical protein
MLIGFASAQSIRWRMPRAKHTSPNQAHAHPTHAALDDELERLMDYVIGRDMLDDESPEQWLVVQHYEVKSAVISGDRLWPR